MSGQTIYQEGLTIMTYADYEADFNGGIDDATLGPQTHEQYIAWQAGDLDHDWRLDQGEDIDDFEDQQAVSETSYIPHWQRTPDKLHYTPYELLDGQAESETMTFDAFYGALSPVPF